MTGSRPILVWRNTRPSRRMRAFGALLLCAWLLIGGAASAWAQVTNLSVNSSFSCTAAGGVPQIITNPPDPNALGLDKPLEHVLTAWQASLFNAIAYGYCGMRALIEGPLLAAGLLAIVIFGITFITGMNSLSAKAVIVMIFKIGLVLMFALNGEIAMKVIYGFFLALTDDAVHWLMAGNNATGATPLSSQDVAIGTFAKLFGNGLTDIDPAAASCSSTVLLFIVFLLLLFPIFGAPVITMFITFLFMFIRAILGFLVALGAVALLMAASPMFIAFALFRTTHSYFDRWLQAIISYSLQMVIVFGIIVISFELFDFWSMFKSLVNTMRPSPDVVSWMQAYKINLGTTQICTPCEGGSFLLSEAIKTTTVNGVTTGTPAFSGYHCPANAKGISRVIDIFVQYDYLKYLIFNTIVVTMVLWGINEILSQSSAIAHELSGKGSAMNLGGAGGDSRNGIRFGGFDVVARNFTAGFRYGYDPGYAMDTKRAIREKRPGYLDSGGVVESIPTRFKNGFMSGIEFAKSERSPDNILATLPRQLEFGDKMNRTYEELNKSDTRLARLDEQIQGLRDREGDPNAERQIAIAEQRRAGFAAEREKWAKQAEEDNYQYNKTTTDGEDQ